jgi:3-hydroxyisobutyrate dehydrogenase-like beta-hydroxyacid dehydrogenase
MTKPFPVIGFIGLGRVGSLMAANLLKAGYRLFVFDIDRAKVNALVQQGAQGSKNLKQLATRCNIIMTSLPHPSISEEIYLAEKGLASNAKKGDLFIETSTISPKLVKKIDQMVKMKGAEFVDAGIAGGLEKAAQGKLVIMAGGSKSAIRKAKDTFRVIGSDLFHVGNVGMGMTVKLVNNAISHVNMVGIAEAVSLGVKAGANAKILYDVISKSSGNSDIFQRRFGYRILNRDFNAGMSVELAYKDSELVCEMGRDLKVPMYVTNAAHCIYEWARVEGLGERDYASIILLWEKLLEIRITG